MMKQDKKFNLILLIYISINIIYTIIGMAFMKYKFINYEKYSYGLVIGAIINAFIIIYIFKSKKYKKNVSDIFIVLCVLFALISCIFSINTKISFFGSNIRHEGFIEIFYYFSLTFLSSFLNKQSRKIVINVIILCGLVQALYSLIYVLYYQRVVLGYINNEFSASSGLTTHTNFLSTYILISLGFSTAMYFNSSKKIYKVVYYISTLILIGGLVVTNTMSGFIGLFLMLVLFAIYIIKYKKIKDVLILFLPFVLMLIILCTFKFSSIYTNLIETINEFLDIIKGNISDDYGTYRIFVWRNSIKIVPKYLLHGCGLDNFIYAFGSAFLVKNNLVFDRAHNEFLNLLVTEGLFSLISYVALLFCLLKSGLKPKKINIAIIPVIGYLIQSMFNIRVIEVAPLFYISLGILINRWENLSYGEKKN